MNIIYIPDSFFYLNMPIMEAITNIIFFPMQYSGFLLSHFCMNHNLFEILSHRPFGLSYDATLSACFVIPWYFWSAFLLWAGIRYLK
jgi:hypothetical protein